MANVVLGLNVSLSCCLPVPVYGLLKLRFVELTIGVQHSNFILCSRVTFKSRQHPTIQFSSELLLCLGLFRRAHKIRLSVRLKRTEAAEHDGK
jgi:hypothetical protein